MFVLYWFMFSEPKGQAPQRLHETKANFSNSDFYSKDTLQDLMSSHGEHKQQKNDRTPRFHKDSDFPKPGHEPLPDCTTPHISAQTQQGKGQERWSRETDRPQNDRRAMLHEQIFPSSVTTTFIRSKEPQQRTEFSGCIQQPTRSGNVGNMTGPSHRRGLQDSAPISKMNNITGKELDGKGNNKHSDRTEEHNNSRRMGKPERPNSDNIDRQRESATANLNLKGGNSGMSQEARLSRNNRSTAVVPAHFQNGDMEHKRTGPIKPLCPPNRDPHPKKYTSNNPGSKRRSGQGKGPRGSEKCHNVDYVWNPGDQCLALYWEDSKVCLSSKANIAIV